MTATSPAPAPIRPLDAAALAARVRATRNRGRCHVFLGDPWSDDADKTTVEPGNGTSPGAWTCGIAAWVVRGADSVTPDHLTDEAIAWELAPPVVTSRWRALGLAIDHATTHIGAAGSEGVDHHRVVVTTVAEGAAELVLAVRDVGPAGGRLSTLAWDGATGCLTIDGGRRLVCEVAPSAVEIVPPDERYDSPLALLRFTAPVVRGGAATIGFRVEHGYAGRPCDHLLPRVTAVVTTAEAAFAEAALLWDEALPARIFAPDPRVARTWEQCAFHLLSAMECGLPRIGALNYPLLWLRDGVIVVRALDLIGRHDLARAGCDHLAPLVFSGGFGAESDAPGEGAWILARHGLMDRDDVWLTGMWPRITERVEWIRRMRTATAPLRAVGHNRMPRYVSAPAINVVCFPAVDGCIHGRMDWHDPDFYINAWAVAGLRAAADVATRLGRTEAAALAAEADVLEAAMRRRLLPRYGNDRDPAVTPWPTGALGDDPALREAFAAWYRAKRLDEHGVRRPEPLWTYFEAAQAHNALLLGLRDEAWACLDGMLAPRGTWDVAAFVEGSGDGNESLPFANGVGEVRGWLDPTQTVGGNMPHNWTTAEVVAALRDVFVVEERDGLVLGRGVPRAWLVPGARFGCVRLPTARGPVSWRADVAADGRVTLAYDGPDPHRFDLPTHA